MDVVAVVSVVGDVVVDVDVDVDVVVVSDVSLRSKPISSKERNFFRSNLTDRNFIDPKPKLFFFCRIANRSLVDLAATIAKETPVFSKHFATVKNYGVFCGSAMVCQNWKLWLLSYNFMIKMGFLNCSP